jgi:hypothetical protein
MVKRKSGETYSRVEIHLLRIVAIILLLIAACRLVATEIRNALHEQVPCACEDRDKAQNKSPQIINVRSKDGL